MRSYFSCTCSPCCNSRADETCGSQLSTHNAKTKQDGESEVNKNDPSIYAIIQRGESMGQNGKRLWGLPALCLLSKR